MKRRKITHQMRKLIILVCFLAAGCLGQTPVVSGLYVDLPSVDSSSLRLIFDASALPVNYRIRWNTTDCSSGSGGTVQPNNVVSSSYVQYGLTASVSGLPPGQTVYFCPEVTTDNIHWSSGVSLSYTMPSADGPAAPVLPAIVPTEFPAQTGAIRNVLPDCSNLQAQVNGASYGDTIVIPAGTVCTTPIVLPGAPEARAIPTSAVNTATSTFTLPGHGFANGQQVHFSTGAANSNCLPGNNVWPNGSNCALSGGMFKGKSYYVVNATANTFQVSLTNGGSPIQFGYVKAQAQTNGSTITVIGDWAAPQGYAVYNNYAIQFASTGTLPGGLMANTDYYPLTTCNTGNPVCTFQVSTTQGGSPVTITSAGTGVLTIVDHGTGTSYVMAWPPPDKWIVVTTGGSVPPAGVRTSSAWQPQMATIENTTFYNSFVYMLNTGVMSHNWRFVGIEWTSAKNNDYLTTIDPRSYGNFMTVGMDSANIIFDRNYVHGWGYPQRLGPVVGFIDGFNVGFINSELSQMDYWHPWYTGFSPTFTSSSLTLAPGQTHFGTPATSANSPGTKGNTVITMTSGTATGNGYVYFDLRGIMQVVLPAGMTATCSTTGITCTVSTAATPAIPTGAGGGIAAEQITQISLNNGSIVAVSQLDGYGSIYNTEGCQCFISGDGPGPYILDNNLISATGIPYHFSDGGGPYALRADYYVHRNTWTTPLDKDGQPFEIAGQAGSDYLRYGHRQLIEWKGGQRILFDGNIMSNTFQEDSPVAPFIALTPRGGGWVTDITITNNIFQGAGLGIEGCLAIDNYLPASRPCQRQRVANNIFANINGYRFSIVGGPFGPGTGRVFYAGWAASDFVYDHNSILPPGQLGNLPEVVHWQLFPSRFLQFTNNIIWDHQAQNGNADGWFVNDGASAVANCATTGDLAFVNCAFPQAKITGNVIIPGYTNPWWPNPSGQWPASGICTAYGGTWDGTKCSGGFATLLVPGASVADSLKNVRWNLNQGLTYGSFLYGSLLADSPYAHTGTDGNDPGVDIISLLRAAGIITVISVNHIGSTEATVTFRAPDPGAACQVAFGIEKSPPYTWSVTPSDTTSASPRNITITGLASQKNYTGQVWCYGTAPAALPVFSTL